MTPAEVGDEAAKLGKAFKKYRQVAIDNGIDGATALKLNDEMLNDLEVKMVHRAVILAKIAAAASAAPAPPASAGGGHSAAEKAAEDIKFSNKLVPELRGWMTEAPTGADAALMADKEQVMQLEEALTTPAARAKLVAVVPAIVLRIRATAAPYTSATHIKRLQSIIGKGDKLYVGMYLSVLDMVRSNDGYDDFLVELDAVVPDASRFPQRSPDLLAIYDAARDAHPLFGAVLEDVAKRAKGDGVVPKETRAAPLKHVFRVLQKHATRVDGGKPTDFETACDIVRGSVVCESMADLLVVLRLLLKMQEEGMIKIVRIKSRFKNPTTAGWADAMLNFVCLLGGAAAAGHVCELQLVHADMLKARKEFGGHSAYAAFREAAELLEFAAGGWLVNKARSARAVLDAATKAAEDAAAVAVESSSEAALSAAAVAASETVSAAQGAEPALQAALAKLRELRSALPAGSSPDAERAADAALEQLEGSAASALQRVAAAGERAKTKWERVLHRSQQRAHEAELADAELAADATKAAALKLHRELILARWQPVPKAQWKTGCSACHLCHQRFSLVAAPALQRLRASLTGRRQDPVADTTRHHCRFCGEAICGACTDNRLPYGCSKAFIGGPSERSIYDREFGYDSTLTVFGGGSSGNFEHCDAEYPRTLEDARQHDDTDRFEALTRTQPDEDATRDLIGFLVKQAATQLSSASQHDWNAAEEAVQQRLNGKPHGYVMKACKACTQGGMLDRAKVHAAQLQAVDQAAYDAHKRAADAKDNLRLHLEKVAQHEEDAAAAKTKILKAEAQSQSNRHFAYVVCSIALAAYVSPTAAGVMQAGVQGGLGLLFFCILLACCLG
jgi:hypothetical protein